MIRYEPFLDGCRSGTVWGICSFGAVSTAASARTTAAPPAVTCGG
jgi:hypothetical protein